MQIGMGKLRRIIKAWNWMAFFEKDVDESRRTEPFLQWSNQLCSDNGATGFSLWLA